MILSDLSVKRPVLASVISLVLIVFGVVSFDRLSLREYPDIDAPIVTVEVGYPGAPANVVETRITELVEERIAGVEGIDFIQSQSSDGESQVSITFNVDRDIDAAANDIRDRVSSIQDNFPEEADPPEVQKADSNDDVIIWRNLTSTKLSVAELTDYAERYLVDQYATLDGVARVRVGGGLDYALRIWLDRKELAARNLSVTDVERALRSENIELPAGRLESDRKLFKARVNRHFTEPEDFNELVLDRGENGYLVRLGDVARVELGVVEDRTFFRGNGVPMVGIGVIKQSTANTIDVTDAVKELTARLNNSLPEGMIIEESYDASVFIEAAIAEVYKTLFFATLCVVFIIFIFLGSARAMLVPALAIPVSITATFIAIYALGFSINLLTLLALVLAIGLVVDDAIVVLENIVRRMQEYGESALVAAYRGARQVGFAVVATTLVLVAVFVPLTFLRGDIGKLFTEFALTIAAAVIFSSLVALTLSVMIASKVLKANKTTKINIEDTSPKENVDVNSSSNAISARIDRTFTRLRDSYLGALKWFLHKPFVVVGVFVVLICGSFALSKAVKQEFVPQEDRGAFFILVNGPEGVNYSYMEEYMTAIEQDLMPYIDAGEFKRMLVRTPRGFGNLENFNSGILIVILEPWGQRRPAAEIMQEVSGKLAKYPGVRAFPVMRQGLGGGTGKPVQFVLGGSTYEELADWRDTLLSLVQENNPGFNGLDSDFKETRPQLDFIVNYQRAADLGVTTQEIGRTLESMLGGRNVTTYQQRGEEYDVIIEGRRDTQKSINDIENIYVRSERSGELIPLSNIVDIKQYGAAETLSRYNRIRSVTLESSLDEGYALGEALSYLETLARENLPEELVIDYKGQSRDYTKSGSDIFFIFALGLVVVFLVLAAQFESYIHPFVIMLTVPLAVGGGLLGLFITGQSLNIYSQIGLIMMVGLAAKNGILIVEFANQLRDKGHAFEDALIQAADKRFRPIVMTGITTAAGSLPLILASGAGAETRSVIGIVVMSGVLATTLFTVFVVPVAYYVLARHTGSPEAVSKKLEQQEREHE